MMSDKSDFRIFFRAIRSSSCHRGKTWSARCCWIRQPAASGLPTRTGVKTGDLMSWSRLDRGDIPDTAKPWTAPSWADPLDPPRQPRRRLPFDALYDRVRAFLERTMAPSASRA
jgi:hypothetical protein